MKKVVCLIAISALATIQLSLHAQAGDSRDVLLKRLNAQFTPTKFTADKSGIVTAGVVVALKKDGLLVYTVTVPTAPISTYKNGKLSQGFGDAMKVGMVDGMGREGGANSIPRKTLVAGEKVWVSAFGVEKDSLLVQVITDPYDDGRYFGILKFPIVKGTTPSPDEAAQTVAEVLDAQPVQAQTEPPPPPPPPTPVVAAPPTQYQDVAPPPPPPPPTATISIGELKTQVAADFGEPLRKASLGAKEIFFYKDMKVTFTNGRVSNVE